MTRTNRSIEILGVRREIWVDAENREYVEQDGDFIQVKGAKLFKSVTSRNYPVPDEVKQLAEELREGDIPFPALSEKEQRKQLDKFFTGVLDVTQKRAKGKL